MRRLACAVTGAPALGLLALAVLCAGAASPRRTASRAFVRATQHEEFVWREATCRRSQPRVLCLKELRPNDTRKFVPHCTILHRCTPDTGCCATEDQHCQAKTVQAVQLHFVVVHMNASGQSSYEPAALMFDNHTECECRLKKEPIR